MPGPAASSPGAAPRVRHLVDVGCPVGGLAPGRARVLSAGARVLLSGGGQFVHVCEPEGRRLSAVLEFPAPVWHLEPLAGPALLALCTGRGLYRVSLDPDSRDSVDSTAGRDSGQCVDSTDGGDSEHEVDSEPPLLRTTVGPAACILPSPTLVAFVVWGDMLVTLAQGPARWKVQLTPCTTPGQNLMPPNSVGEVDLPADGTPAASPGQPQAPLDLPVLCIVAPPGPRGLDAALFGLLFGADACLLHSPVLLCGLPGGQLCAVLLQALVTSSGAPGDPQALVRTIHHLEEPVVWVGVLRTEPPAEGLGDAPSDCLVALGRGGRLLAIKACQDEAGSPVLELREYRIPGPVLCAAGDGGSCLLLSTPSGLQVVDLALGSDPRDPRGLPPDLCPASTSICSLAALTVTPRAPGGTTELLALSVRGRLLACNLTLARAGTAGSAQHIGALLSRITATSERVMSLNATTEQQNRALQSLNAAVGAACALLRSQGGPGPMSCRVQASWTRLPSGDMLLAHCVLETSPDFSLGEGWALCVGLQPGSKGLDAAASCMVPLGALGPGAQRSLTVPLGSGEDGAPELPVTVSCQLLFSLRDSVGAALGLGALPRHEAVGLPLSRHVLDILHALRFPDLPASAAAPGKPPLCPLDAFLQALCELGPKPGTQYLPPTGAALRVSAQLLQTTLTDRGTDMPLLPATLRWLLSGNDDVARAPTASCLRGVAPDGTDVLLRVREVCVPDVSPAGPLQAVEIRVESPSLAVLCAVHSAVTRRVQALIMEQASHGPSPPELCVQHLRRVQASHEMLLREIRTLQEQLRLGEPATPRATAQRLLRAFQQLRSPGPLLL
ncbi:Fanconi anemia core complex-associated protein 100 [Sorex fumeus]|uniref:Fanconi anemia core complex-associated protein 100 n=1 Tax=Sorex fumeus TaxID=62283 RepID=UPI0024AE6A05|nr:Fanconi anemia core complex-associated protein 100 [Sorex fumeus]